MNETANSESNGHVNPKWWFRPEPPDRQKDYGNANLWAMKWDIDTFVRETVQNITDVPMDRDKGAGVEFKIIRLTGDRLEQFLTSLLWDDVEVAESLSPHIKGSAVGDQKLAIVLRGAIKELTNPLDELLLLRVDDWGTRGLLGEEFDTGHFAALCRNNLDSNKPEGKVAGGSYGLGKAVLWRASRFATVLFRSDLSEPISNGNKNARLFGRSDLTWHEIDDKRFAGPGWFGREEGPGKPTVSVWNNESLASDLYLAREVNPFPELSPTGTSILVTAFADASSENQQNTSQIAQQFESAIAKNFWPALEDGKLQAKVSTWENDEQVKSLRVRPEDVPEVKPFIDMLRAHRNLETHTTLSEFTNPGSVVSIPVALTIPRSRGEGAQGHPETQHEAILLIRNAQYEDDRKGGQGPLVYFRGKQMIVKSDLLSIPGSVPFNAIVLCGTAAGTTLSDTIAETFLRTSEPPVHNDWLITPELKETYVAGAGANLTRFFSEVKAQIRNIVRPPLEDTTEGPEGLRTLLRIGNEAPPRTTGPQVEYSGHVDDRGRWVIESTVKIRDGRGWRFRPVLKFAVESGTNASVDWETLELVSGGEIQEEHIIAPPGVREVRFRGISDVKSHPIAATQSAVFVDLHESQSVVVGETPS